MKDINGGFLSENDDATIFEFESPLGVFYFQTEVLDLVRTNAHFSVDDITTFVISDELMVNIADKTIAAHGNVQINSNQINLSGDIMTADLIENKIRIKRNVQGSIIPN